MTYQIYQGDVVEWAKGLNHFQERKLARYSKDRDGWNLGKSFASLKFGLRFSMARMAEGDKVAQIIGAFVVTIKEPKGYFVMNSQKLLKFLSAFLLGQAAFLTDVIISFKSFTSLSVPVRTMPIAFVAIDVVRGILAYPMLITAFSATVLSDSLATKSTCVDRKCFVTIEASKVYVVFLRSFLYSSILALGGAMSTSAVLKSARDNIKRFSARLVFANSFNRLFHCLLKTKPLVGLAALVSKQQTNKPLRGQGDYS